MISLFEIRDSGISGKGAFATRKIFKGDRICFMKGEIVSEEEIDRRMADGSEVQGDPFQIGEHKFIDLDEEFRSINHSCDPNAFIRGVNELVACKNIEEDEEITYDYSCIMWEDSDEEDWDCTCQCKSDKCRGKITQFYNLPEDVKKRYIENKQIPDFIIKKLTKK